MHNNIEHGQEDHKKIKPEEVYR